MRNPSFLLLAAVALAAMLGCSSRSAPYPMAPLPIGPSGGGYATEKPAAVFTATPDTIQPGETVLLQWSSLRADEAVMEPGAGTVPLKGSLEVRPTADTTYTLWLRGPGGESTATARVSVRSTLDVGTTEDENAGRNGRLFSGTFQEEVSSRLQDIFFDYDSNAIRPDQQPTLDENARTLRALFEEFPEGNILVEGHCDERGSSEYNLALGDRRAQSIVEYLGQQGIPTGRMRLVGYGEEMPQCTQANESCYQLNRRAHFNPQP